jgi:hypothetical protein
MEILLGVENGSAQRLAVTHRKMTIRRALQYAASDIVRRVKTPLSHLGEVVCE